MAFAQLSALVEAAARRENGGEEEKEEEEEEVGMGGGGGSEGRGGRWLKLNAKATAGPSTSSPTTS